MYFCGPGVNCTVHKLLILSQNGHSERDWLHDTGVATPSHLSRWNTSGKRSSFKRVPHFTLLLQIIFYILKRVIHVFHEVWSHPSHFSSPYSSNSPASKRNVSLKFFNFGNPQNQISIAHLCSPLVYGKSTSSHTLKRNDSLSPPPAATICQ